MRRDVQINMKVDDDFCEADGLNPTIDLRVRRALVSIAAAVDIEIEAPRPDPKEPFDPDARNEP